MKLLDQDKEVAIDNVLVTLERSEAKDLIRALVDLLAEPSGTRRHEHVSSADYQIELTVHLQGE